jgi:hypothetical protein
MHVEVDPAELRLLGAVTANDVVDEHVLMPASGRLDDALVAQIEDLRRDLQEPREHALVREVLADLARVDLVLRLLHAVLEPDLLPVGDVLRVGVDALQLREQLLVVLLCARGGELPHLLDELGGAVARADHLVGGDVVRPVGKAEE